MDDIPIVRLDDDMPPGRLLLRVSVQSLTIADQEAPPAKRKTATRTTAKEKPGPPQFDRSGEMPEGGSDEMPDRLTEQATGLAGVDLLSDERSSRPTSRFEEYRVEGEEPNPVQQPSAADEPVKGEIEVVKVKRKKKKDGSKKRSEGAKEEA